jgi:hypothetical protein
MFSIISQYTLTFRSSLVGIFHVLPLGHYDDSIKKIKLIKGIEKKFACLFHSKHMCSERNKSRMTTSPV